MTGANTPRDFRVDAYEDLVAIREGDPCPIDGATSAHRPVDRRGPHLPARHALLGAAEGAFVDEDGTERPYEMGSYGIGISRIMAAAAEQFHDEAGLRWPKVLAPFDVVIVCQQ